MDFCARIRRFEVETMIITNFEMLKERIADTDEIDPRTVLPDVWASTKWEKLAKKETEDILFPFLEFQFKRSQSAMPEIYSAYIERKIKLHKFADLELVPALVKDTANQGIGFRAKIQQNPYLLLPRDLKKSISVYKSGGTRGIATPTFISDWDEAVETTTLQKCFSYMNIKAQSKVMNTYNPTHKGGLWITKAMQRNGATVISRRMNETAREIIQTIKHYGITVLATVQGPLTEGDATKKGGGVDFLSLVEEGQDILEEKIETLFITGYSLIPEVISWAEMNKKNLATVLGSSEAIPQASSTLKGKLCRYNNMHLINGPHYIEILKQESGQLVPVKRGENGILAYTTIAREGTIYIRYAPGDSAKLVAKGGECDCGIKTPIISDIRRMDIPEDTLAAGCCIG